VLGTQIIERDNLAAGTTFAVESLDHKNWMGIGDLRGRVARSQFTPRLHSYIYRESSNIFRSLVQMIYFIVFICFL